MSGDRRVDLDPSREGPASLRGLKSDTDAPPPADDAVELPAGLRPSLPRVTRRGALLGLGAAAAAAFAFVRDATPPLRAVAATTGPIPRWPAFERERRIPFAPRPADAPRGHELTQQLLDYWYGKREAVLLKEL